MGRFDPTTADSATGGTWAIDPSRLRALPAGELGGMPLQPSAPGGPSRHGSAEGTPHRLTRRTPAGTASLHARLAPCRHHPAVDVSTTPSIAGWPNQRPRISRRSSCVDGRVKEGPRLCCYCSWCSAGGHMDHDDHESWPNARPSEPIRHDWGADRSNPCRHAQMPSRPSRPSRSMAPASRPRLSWRLSQRVVRQGPGRV